MQEMRDTKREYDVSILKLVRNNNIATGAEVLKEYDTYFMLDYFDVLCHSNLISENKTYKKFWNISDNQDIKRLNYKTAYKTLSLYTRPDAAASVFQIDKTLRRLSDTPFLGIIQINFVHYPYSQKFADETKVFCSCERKIKEYVDQIISMSDEKCDYHLYRSSTSGDYCLVIKSAAINLIFKLASSINNLIIPYEGENLVFNTYTNLGIECLSDDDLNFYGFLPETVEKNQSCTFALRFTASNEFAQKLYEKVKSSKQQKEIVIETMEGLFGRYDFLLYLSMKEFANIYPTLCKSKIVGWNQKEQCNTKENSELIELFQEGIQKGVIRVINERVLVPLAEVPFGMPETSEVVHDSDGIIREKELEIGKLVDGVNKKFQDEMERIRNCEEYFTEERRVFIDISRELWEIISTYVPQGRESDAHVNWLILVSDLNVTFKCIDSWLQSYEMLESEIEKKQEREHFLEDLRLNVDAINRFYTFLQNVNAQTWQSPLYEIQTQLDTEKMMIAYREFLHGYFEIYSKEQQSPMLYPIVYPEMMTDRACASEPFKRYDTEARLLICKVPSFEYYGRMFNMIPWILHEASHSLRTMERGERNNHITEVVIKSVFTQTMYELLNRYSNDFGYHRLGRLESDIVDSIVSEVTKEFKNNFPKMPMSKLTLNFLQTELLDFLDMMFDQDIDNMGNKNRDISDKEIKKALLRFLTMLGILTSNQEEAERDKILKYIEECDKNSDYLLDLLQTIYGEYYKQLTGQEPEDENDWKILTQDIYFFEDELEKKIEGIKKADNAEKIKDFCFSMRELNRIYDACGKGYPDDKRGEKHRNNIWKNSIPEIRMKIEKGFQDDKGFTELYRILNMIFGDNGEPADNEAKRVGNEFNLLFQQHIHKLVEREIKIYRETCADLYMASTLGFEAFGYCRQMFQTLSDASVENSMDWAESINVRRYRAVAAVLLTKGKKDEDVIDKCGDIIRIPMTDLLEKGEKYCYASVDCIQDKIIHKIKNESQKELMQQFLKEIRRNIKKIFQLFITDDMVHEAVRDSMLSVWLNQDADTHMEKDPDVGDVWKRVKEKYSCLRDETKKFDHVMYRIKCFILLLEMISQNGYIEIERKEYVHLKKLYDQHQQSYGDFAEECCQMVADYYNDPSSAKEKTPAEMLDNTLYFIEKYYYRNRFKIMASGKIRKVVETNGAETT